jgi:type I restriction enzyme, S subunit
LALSIPPFAKSTARSPQQSQRRPRPQSGKCIFHEGDLSRQSDQRLIAAAIDIIENSILLEDRAFSETANLKHAAMYELFTRGLRCAQKETEIGPLPINWTAESIGDLTSMVYRYPTYYGISYQPAGVPEIRGELLTENGEFDPHWANYRFISEETAAQFPNVRLRAGDIVLSVRGTMGKVGIAREAHVGAVITANLIRLAPLKCKIDPDFFKYVLMSERFARALDSASPQTTIKTITAPVLKSLKIPVPPTLDEQREIVTALDAIERKTDLHVRKRASLQDLSKMLARKLIAGDISVSELDFSELPLPEAEFPFPFKPMVGPSAQGQ